MELIVQLDVPETKRQLSAERRVVDDEVVGRQSGHFGALAIRRLPTGVVSQADAQFRQINRGIPFHPKAVFVVVQRQKVRGQVVEASRAAELTDWEKR